MQQRTIAVLFGGQSGEHEVSLVSAHAVMSALDPAKYRVLPMGIKKDGHWLVGSDALAQLVAEADPHKLPKDVRWQTIDEEHATDGRMVPSDMHRPWHPGTLFRALHVDVVFPVLHGPMGEDGTVQGLLELAHVPYVGCGVAASAVGLDKALMKAAFAAVGLPQLPWVLVRRSAWRHSPPTIYDHLEAQLSYPMFVKPANMGSSVGVNKATDRTELEAALTEAATYDRRIVVEQGIDAREIEVSVLGNDQPQASVPGEVVPAGEWYSYSAKYLSGQSQIVIPAHIDAALRERVQTLAAQAFLAIDGAGLSRVDFLLDKTSGELWLNEVNTLPGFTSVSMYAKMWAADGLAYSALLDRLIDLALERYHERH
jgi:D-alanine-D-alanine ligase